jgi:hypothetical protein
MVITMEMLCNVVLLLSRRIPKNMADRGDQIGSNLFDLTVPNIV